MDIFPGDEGGSRGGGPLQALMPWIMLALTGLGALAMYYAGAIGWL